jgi:hypothetical protein
MTYCAWFSVKGFSRVTPSEVGCALSGSDVSGFRIEPASLVLGYKYVAEFAGWRGIWKESPECEEFSRVGRGLLDANTESEVGKAPCW